MLKCTIYRTPVPEGNKCNTKKWHSNFSTNNCVFYKPDITQTRISGGKKIQTYAVLYTNRTGIRC